MEHTLANRMLDVHESEQMSDRKLCSGCDDERTERWHSGQSAYLDLLDEALGALSREIPLPGLPVYLGLEGRPGERGREPRSHPAFL